MVGVGMAVLPAWVAAYSSSSMVGGRWVGRTGAQRLCDRGEAGERGGQLESPGPVRGHTDEDAALASGDAGGHVQHPVAQCLGDELAGRPRRDLSLR
jgi:hypothetical protein